MASRIVWSNVAAIPGVEFTCGYCGRVVASDQGWFAQNPDVGQSVGGLAGYANFFLALCPRCGNPTYIKGPVQVPGDLFGDRVAHLPVDVAALYGEARDSVGRGNYTAATMVGRKILMNVAATKGAAPGQPFAAYVEHLLETHVITPDMQPWVDEIRLLGNEANHEITMITKEQAEDLITFVAMLLKIVYEYPGRHQEAVTARMRNDGPEEPSRR